jgi:hypothetical protein
MSGKYRKNRALREAYTKASVQKRESTAQYSIQYFHGCRQERYRRTALSEARCSGDTCMDISVKRRRGGTVYIDVNMIQVTPVWRIVFRGFLHALTSYILAAITYFVLYSFSFELTQQHV